MPLFAGKLSSSVFSATSPPAEAPTPTTGNGRSLGMPAFSD